MTLSEVYQKHNEIITESPQKNYISVEVDADSLQQLNLPNDFVVLII